MENMELNTLHKYCSMLKLHAIVDKCGYCIIIILEIEFYYY